MPLDATHRSPIVPHRCCRMAEGFRLAREIEDLLRDVAGPFQRLNRLGQRVAVKPPQPPQGRLRSATPCLDAIGQDIAAVWPTWSSPPRSPSSRSRRVDCDPQCGSRWWVLAGWTTRVHRAPWPPCPVAGSPGPPRESGRWLSRDIPLSNPEPETRREHTPWCLTN